MEYGMFAFGMIGLVLLSCMVAFIVLIFDVSQYEEIEFCCTGDCNQGRDCPMRKKDD